MKLTENNSCADTVNYKVQSFKTIVSAFLALTPVTVYLVFYMPPQFHDLYGEYKAPREISLQAIAIMIVLTIVFCIPLYFSIKHFATRIQVTPDLISGTDSSGKSFIFSPSRSVSVSQLGNEIFIENGSQRYCLNGLSNASAVSRAIRENCLYAPAAISQKSADILAKKEETSSEDALSASSVNTTPYSEASSNKAQDNRSESSLNSSNRAYTSAWASYAQSDESDTSVAASNYSASASSVSSSSSSSASAYPSGSHEQSAPSAYASPIMSTAYGEDNETSIISSNFSKEHNRTAVSPASAPSYASVSPSSPGYGSSRAERPSPVNASSYMDMTAGDPETSLDDGGTNILSAGSSSGMPSSYSSPSSYRTQKPYGSSYAACSSSSNAYGANDAYGDETVLGPADYTSSYAGSSAASSASYSSSWQASRSYGKSAPSNRPEGLQDADDDFFTQIG